MVDQAPYAPDGLAALGRLRSRRARRRTDQVHWVDAFYQAYLTAIVVAVAVLVASGWVGDAAVSAAGMRRLVDDGPAVGGIVVAVALAVGMRSGARGGPLALEPAEVAHVLAAPLPTRAVLRGPALRQLRFGAFAGLVAGAVAGQLAYRRVEGNPFEWIGSGAVFGALVVAAALVVGWVCAGRRLPGWAASAVGVALIGWAVAGLVADVASPMRTLGAMVVWPVTFDGWALLAVPAVAALGWVGLAGLGGVSIEAAQRRTALVGQLRFAATMRDLRTVIVLRRQLAQERPRARPWARLPVPASQPVVARGLRSAARTPLGRLVRLAGLGAGVALAARAAWQGTTPLLLVAGLGVFLAGLDAIEPLAQELDHPTVLDLAPVEGGGVLARHVVVPLLTMGVVALVGLLVSLTGGMRAQGALVALSTAASGAVMGTVAAVVSVVRAAPGSTSTQLSLVAPEAAGMRVVYSTAFPPALALAGFAPLLVGREAFERGEPVTASVVLAAAMSATGLFGLVGWLRVRERASSWWQESLEAMTAGPGGTAREEGR